MPLWYPMRCFIREAFVIHCVRNDKYTLGACAVVQKVVSRPPPDGQTGIEFGDEPAIQRTLYRPFDHPAIRMQVRIAARHNRCPRTPARPHRLPGALVVPAVDDYRVESFTLDYPRKLRRIQSSEIRHRGFRRYILEKSILITAEQRDVPIEFNAETRS